MSKSYFRYYHSKKAEYIVTMLENEMWQLCPINAGFSVRDLKDYKTFMSTANSAAVAMSVGGAGASGGGAVGRTSSGASLLSAYVLSNMNPFSSKGQQASSGANPLSPRVALTATATTPSRSGTAGDTHSDDEEVDEELMQEFVEDGGTEPHTATPKRKDSATLEGAGQIVTLTSINLVKYIGKYLQMMRVLQPIAFDVFVEITHLCEYYAYVVYMFFGQNAAAPVVEETTALTANTLGSAIATSILNRFADGALGDDKDKKENKIVLPPWLESISDLRIKTMLARIDQTLIRKPGAAVTPETEGKFSMAAPRFPEMLDLQSTKNMFGIPERAVRAERACKRLVLRLTLSEWAP